MNNETIITFDILDNKIRKLITDQEELALIEKAYHFACEKHEGRKRINGDDYILHPLHVANILVDLNVDAETIIAALIHETLNHGTATNKEIADIFGEDMSLIVQSISRINKLELANNKESSAIYLRKVLVGMAEDVRVLIVKLADRLHNMRTAYVLQPEVQVFKATETMNVLIPIAHRLGINSIKSELEDLCLRYLKPEEYHEIEEKLNNTKEEMNELINEMKEEISDILSDHDISFSLKGRVKSIYSIYNKLQTGRKWNDIYDILALRVYVEKESDCYLAVGLIHAKFRPIPKRFKDYIAMPKANLYQSLHTTVFGVEGKLFEIQIRTYEMDEIAEKGIASHWSYKEKESIKIQNIMEQKLEIFRNLIEANNENNASDTEFAQHINQELLSDLIYCFTPKGDVVELPKDSTPVDFAFRIHSQVGEKIAGAIVNDNIVPLDYKLNDGDIINILTNNNNTPKKAWLNFVVTSQARNKIKAYFSKQDKTEYVEKGQNLLQRELKRQKITNSDFFDEKNITKILKDLKLNELDDLYLAIGALRFTPGYVIDLMHHDKQEITDVFLKKINGLKASKHIYNKDILVSNYDDILVSIAQCCKPIKGDPIIGYITKGKGIVVHRQDCQNVNGEDKHLIDVAWNDKISENYFTDIIIDVELGKNHLLDIVTLASLKNIFFEAVNTIEKDTGITYLINVKVAKSEDLVSFLNEIRQKSYVTNAERVKK